MQWVFGTICHKLVVIFPLLVRQVSLELNGIFILQIIQNRPSNLRQHLRRNRNLSVLVLWLFFLHFGVATRTWDGLDHQMSADPCLTGAPRLWNLDTVRFATIIGQLSAICCSAFSCQSSAVKAKVQGYSRPPPARLRIRYTTKNPSIFKPVPRAAKTRKTAPTAHKNKKQHTHRNQQKQNTFCEQLFFARHYPRKPGFRSPRRPNVDSKVDNK